ncbi:MAG: glycerophosphodiester phosphodiesterase [Thermoleophilaceae bacterium]|nr:glycerophosphodiester phosphodiesterase [Thermoleophilaceae bacterium]
MRSERLLRPAAAAALTLIVAALAGPSLAGGKQRHRPAAGADDKPLVIGHRGAAGYRPEHTLASYALAARMGADYIEPDLVSTKDGVLVARHEPEISGTTDVAGHPEFADRKTTREIDGAPVTGWFTDDFTLAELRTLRAKERLPAVRRHNTLYDGRYRIPTFQEVIDLRARLSRELNRRIGIYPETKHPTYFKERGLPLGPPLVRILKRNGLDGPRDRVFVQSFEVGNLRALHRKIDVPLVQLFDEEALAPYDFVIAGDARTYADLATDEGLRGIARYAAGVGPWKNYIVPRDAADGSGTPTDFVERAHRAGLLVHPYTFRNENQFLPLELRKGADPNAYGDAFAEYEQFYALGVDGLFSDNPDTAVAARDGL